MLKDMIARKIIMNENIEKQEIYNGFLDEAVAKIDRKFSVNKHILDCIAEIDENMTFMTPIGGVYTNNALFVKDGIAYTGNSHIIIAGDCDVPDGLYKIVKDGNKFDLVLLRNDIDDVKPPLDYPIKSARADFENRGNNIIFSEVRFHPKNPSRGSILVVRFGDFSKNYYIQYAFYAILRNMASGNLIGDVNQNDKISYVRIDSRVGHDVYYDGKLHGVWFGEAVIANFLVDDNE